MSYKLWVISSELMNCMGRTRKRKKKLEGENCWTRWMTGTVFYFAFWLDFVFVHWTPSFTRPFSRFMWIHIIMIPLHHAAMQSIAHLRKCGVMCTWNNYFDLNRWLKTFWYHIYRWNILEFICWWIYRYLLLLFPHHWSFLFNWVCLTHDFYI